MKRQYNITERILLLIILAVIILPALQKETGLFRIQPLDGDFVLAEKPDLCLKAVYSGTYQSAFSDWLEHHIGFRNLLVRTSNQVDFSLFRKTHGEGVVVGKKGQLFEYDYIRTHKGIDFIGSENLDRFLRRLKYLQTWLEKEHHTILLLVIEPGKAAFMPENIPDHFEPEERSLTNYEYIVGRARELGVDFLDLQDFFQSCKSRAGYPMYPPHGTHWSIYGMSLAADTLVKYLEYRLGTDLNDIDTDSMAIEYQARRPDYDIGRALNLLCWLPEKTPLAYPLFRFEDNPGKKRPAVLVVGDSYYWNIYNTKLPARLFEREVFWYFYSEVFPESYHSPMRVEKLDLRRETEKQEVIILTITDRFLYKLGWGFIDDLYGLYAPVSRYDRIPQYLRHITCYEPWFKDLVSQSQKTDKPLEVILNNNALYQYGQEDFNSYMVLVGEWHYEQMIRSDSKWVEKISQKAREQGVSLDSALNRDARYLFANEHPGLYRVHERLTFIMDSLQRDTATYMRILEMAGFYQATPEEMLLIESETILEKDHPDAGS
ncbi:MAG: hypothetical protein JW861_07110 [Bacteroidales bacterium]|nr:hypothetical protein [Bacteroidales bacterium]